MGCIEASSTSEPSPILNSIDSLKALAIKLKYVCELEMGKLSS